jgi:hypothetical protein
MYIPQIIEASSKPCSHEMLSGTDSFLRLLEFGFPFLVHSVYMLTFNHIVEPHRLFLTHCYVLLLMMDTKMSPFSWLKHKSK